jgi:CRP-like cAMP-binding protein
MPIDLFRNEENAFPLPEGDDGDVMYAVVEGGVEIIVKGNIAAVLGEGEIFGEMALIDESPRSATARAKTDWKLAVINMRRFLFMVENTPFFAIEVMRTMAHRLENLNRMMWGGEGDQE